ncbi:hypothetical protein BH23GEM7_BH23GEM7_20090 [soil metagenome]
MLFNSLQFLFFFPVVVALYFATPHRFRWTLLLAASYYFYACWKPEYLLLIIASTLVDYGAALGMGAAATQARRKAFLALSLGSNLGLLFAFKYFNFFNESARALFDQFNLFYGVPAFDVLLPVGISFYTFQTLSYTIDVYRGQREPERHLGIFALYVSFFPQLVAGPIERSTRLLPQFFEKHEFSADRVSSGLRLILWGFFKKIVIADRLAIYVNEVYGNPAGFDGPTLLLATYFFAFQIYCDFSAYSDIAIGAARVMGFELMQNFRRPYFARSIHEFWQRWHISLSTWFRDYVYIPLGGNRVPFWRWYVNLFAVFLVSGLWHGANWTFVVWGGLHGFYLVFSLMTRNVRDRGWEALGRLLPARPAALEPSSAPLRLAPALARVASGTASLEPMQASGLQAAVRGWWGGVWGAGERRPGGAAERPLPRSRFSLTGVREMAAVFVTFHLVLLAWIFFRAASLSDALLILRNVLIWEGGSARVLVGSFGAYQLALAVAAIFSLLAAQVVQSRWEVGELLARAPTWVRWAGYYLLILVILIFGNFGGSQFIYFQF